MRNRNLHLLALLSIALIFTLVLPVEARSTTISWCPETIELELFPGTSTVASAEVVASEASTDLSLWVVPELERFIDIHPQSFDRADVGVRHAVVLLVSIPHGTTPDTYDGTLHIRVGRRTLPQTLKLTLHVNEASSDFIPPTISLPSEDRIVDDPETGTRFVRDEILVGFVLGTPQAVVTAAVSGVDGTFLGSVPELDLYQIQVDVADLTELNETMEQLDANEVVAFAVRHWLYDVEMTPNDPRFDTWDEGNPAGNNWGQETVRMPSAWEASTGAQSVRIGVVDTGFDVKHEDLIDNIYYAENPDLGINRLVLPMWQAVTTHGTNVAGVISAQGNNGVGIAGIMWDSSLMLYGASVPEEGILIGFTPHLDPVVAVGGMIDAITKGAKVINFSAGALTASEAEAEAASAPYERVLEWAQQTGRDVLFVFAAGNEASEASLVAPATLARKYPNVISVAAMSRTGELWSWSNFGSAVSVAAPGEAIYTTFPFNPPFGLSGDYDSTTGTSIAAPFVTGLAGLIWSLDTNTTAARVKQLIVDGAEAGGRRVPGHDFYMINAYESLKLLGGPQVVATIAVAPLGDGPICVGVNVRTNRIYVSNYFSNNLAVIDGTTNAVVATVLVGLGPIGVDVNPNTNRIYVASFHSNSVSVIDGNSNLAIATIPVGFNAHPHGIGVNPNTNRIYVANQDLSNVSVIDGETNRVIATIGVPARPRGLAVNPATNRIYVASGESHSVSVIDGSTNAVAATIDLGAGHYPVGMAVDTGLNRAYAGAYRGLLATVDVIDGNTNAVVASVAVSPDPFDVAVNPNTGHIYATSQTDDNISVIDAHTNTVIATITLGDQPLGIGVNPYAGRIYVANRGSNTISVIAETAGP